MVERKRLPGKGVVAVMFLVAFGFQASTASAQTVPGSWNVTFYLEPGHITGATHCVIFFLGPVQVGEPVSGVWRATTFPGWNGSWIKEGDHIRWYGATDATVPLGTAEWGLQARGTLMSGEFAHFSSSEGQTSSSGAWVATRRLTACPASSAEAEAAAEGGGDPARGQ